MIKIHSDHKPTLQIFINQELIIDDTLLFKKSYIQPSVNTEIKSLVVKNKGDHSFTANNCKIFPNSTVDILNK